MPPFCGPAHRFAIAALAAVLFSILGTPGLAQLPEQEIRDRVEQLERELAALKAQLGDIPADRAEQQPAQPGTAALPVRPDPVSRRLSGQDSPLSRSRLLIAGYAFTGANLSDKESAGGTFVAGSFNPGFYFQYDDWLLFEGELEFEIAENGDTETALEFGQVDLLVHDNATLVFGKFLSPVGQFQERLHANWINRLPDPPAGFGHDGVQPGAEVGAQVRGGVSIGRSRLNYAVAVGNGPRLDAMGAVMTEGFGSDDGGNKAISGRIGFLPVPELEVGASFMRSRVRGAVAEKPEEMTTAALAASSAATEGELDGMALPATRYSLWGFDAAYTGGPWDIRFEYLDGVRNAIFMEAGDGASAEALPKLKMRAWYGQLAYRLSGLTKQPILENFEPVVRYGEYKIGGLDDLAEEAAERRLDIALNYWFTPSFVLHSALQRRRFPAREEDRKDTRVLLQLAYGF